MEKTNIYENNLFFLRQVKRPSSNTKFFEAKGNRLIINKKHPAYNKVSKNLKNNICIPNNILIRGILGHISDYMGSATIDNLRIVSRTINNNLIHKVSKRILCDKFAKELRMLKLKNKKSLKNLIDKYEKAKDFKFTRDNIVSINLADFEIDYDLIILLKSMPSIKKLEFLNSQTVTNAAITDILREVKNLEILSISNCNNINDLYIKSKTLRKIKLYYNYGLTDKSVTFIVKNCPNLETLELRKNKSLENPSISSNSLKYLIIGAGNIEKSGIRDMLLNCKKLDVIKSFTDNFSVPFKNVMKVLMETNKVEKAFILYDECNKNDFWRVADLSKCIINGITNNTDKKVLIEFILKHKQLSVMREIALNIFDKLDALNRKQDIIDIFQNTKKFLSAFAMRQITTYILKIKDKLTSEDQEYISDTYFQK
ncbi:hypothetical protein ACFL2K_03275 [Candidatus Margulisiibacteriota bacterium]